MNSVVSPIRRGNAFVVIIILIAIVVAAGIAVVVAERGAAMEERRSDPNMPIRTLDTLLQPVAEWAAAAVTEWSGANGGKLPSNTEGAGIIKDLKNRPPIVGAANFTTTPVYRLMDPTHFEIVLASAQLDGSAHLAYPFTADGRLLAPVPDNVFLNSSEQERDGLLADPGEGTDPR